MRIQHNIMAMNAYRNYNTNTSALSKNLEKLSSGYKINRAGDDAAGLAISEKMRAQITGLEGAQKNAKDGISLVQTAEGALTEVHDMLNRMYSLAEQSANGTYENEVDREQLQKEVEQLRTEINRIADSANFNGINLLDGSLGESSAIETSLTTSDLGAEAGIYKATISGLDTALDGNGAKGTMELTFSDGQKVTVELERIADSADTKAQVKITIGDTTTTITAAATTGLTANDLSAGLTTALNSAVKGFTVADGTGSINFTATEKGTSAPQLTGASYSITQDDGITVSAGSMATTTTTPAANDRKQISDGDLNTAYDGTNLDDAKFTFNGKDYVIVTDASKAKGLDDSITVLVGDPATDQASIAAQLSKASGVEVTRNAGNNGYVFDAKTTSKGLSLQIGDTGESFNQLEVTIDDCHAAAMGIDSVDIGTQAGAKAALDTIKDAINYVSDVRGGLGATQNRLDHTINNLSVMQENIQDAESSIRDTDVADEMMEYTKNNILIQSAQAMLAQANQVPQGVLQLLQ